ncbi:MAG: hypothetical protein VYA54_02885 [Bdellovibrionota bacterium]|nr:hypothetical protein [Bdellovibrionota bacterium]
MIKVLLLLLVSFNIFAGEISIKVEPLRPVYKESYEVQMTVELEGDEEPAISFTPINMEILNKREAGTQTRASFINGTASITKSITYVYEVVSNRFGTAFMKDITVESGGQKYTHPTVRITILQQPQEAKSIFVRAEPDKETAFVGESVLVRYYLYSRDDVSITSTDVKKFPKLDRFLKRFHQEQMIPERVRVDDRIYVRRVIYTAQVFAEKSGSYELDPLSLRIGYSTRSSRSGNFGGFSFNMGRSKSSTIGSQIVKIEVKDLPVEGMPKSFTGLVGEHDFKIKINKNKFIVNEPIEIQLEVSGEGAFELFDPPSVLSVPEVEEFDKKADLAIRKDFSAIKKVDYTYLARDKLDLKGHSVEFSYFDPVVMNYKKVVLPIGDITISGTKSKAPIKNNTAGQDPNLAPFSAPITEKKEFDMDPYLKPVNTVLYNAKELGIAFAVGILFLIGIFLKQLKEHFTRETKIDYFKEIYKNGVSYKDLVVVFNAVSNQSDLRSAIGALPLSENAKEYFYNLIDQLNLHYKDGGEGKLKIKKKFFKEIEKIANSKNDIVYKL